MRLNMLGVPRPVRIVDNSSRLTPTAFSIFSSASKRVSSIIAPLLSSRRNQRPDFLTRDSPSDIAVGQEIENEDRHAIVHAQAEGGCIGHLQPTVDDLAVRDRREQFGRG